MKHSHLRLYLVVLACAPACMLAQPWSGVLSPSRAIDWTKAGAGTLSANRTQCGSTIAAYGSSGSPAAATTINNAIAACGPNQYVMLGAGTFYLNTGISFHNGSTVYSNVTVRGSGADQTVLIFSGTDGCGGLGALVCVWNSDGNYYQSPSNFVAWTGGYTRGSTSITLASHANLLVGSLLYLTQANDTYKISAATCSGGIVTATIGTNTFSMANGKPIATIQGTSPSGYSSPASGGYYPVTAVTGTTVSYNLGGACPSAYVSGGTMTLDDGALTVSNDGTFAAYAAAGDNSGYPGNTCAGGFGCYSSTQAVIVQSCGTSTVGAACSSNTVTISSPVYDPHIRADRNPSVWYGTSVPITGVGVENMTLDATNASPGGIVYFNNATYSWTKGLRTIFAKSSHVLIWQSSHITVRDSYMYGNQGHGGSSTQSYCTDYFSASSDNLIENNIYQHCAAAQALEGGMGNVSGYNYSIDNDNPPSGGTYPLNESVTHAAGEMYDLWEGNSLLSFDLDDFHGTSGNFATFFRNRFRGFEPGKNTQTFAAYIQTGSRNVNVIGNVLGLTGFHTTYEWIQGTNSNTNEAGCSASVIVTGFSGHCDSRIATGNCDNQGTCEIDDVRVNPPDAAEPGTTMLWGNWDAVNNTVRWNGSEVPSSLPIYANSVPANNSLTNSWYGANYTAFWTTPWGTPPYPPIGPDVSGGSVPLAGGHANGLPAQLCFQNSPIDSSYSTTLPVTQAAWSSAMGGTAIINIGSAAASLDTGSVVAVTGMNPAAYNCTDRTVCQVSTCSNTTCSAAAGAVTITYPLANNPGTYVSGGTATIPLLLKFNAANCYSGSGSGSGAGTGGGGGGTSSLLPPTSLTAAVN